MRQFTIVEVTLKGPIDVDNGMVANISDLKKYMQVSIVHTRNVL